MTRLSVPRFGIIAVLVAAIAAAAAALAVSSQGGHSASAAAPADSSPLDQRLSVMRTSPEALTSAVAAAASPRSAELGLQLNHAQRVNTARGAVWIVPGTDVVCVFQSEGDAVGGGCADADHVAAEGLVVGSRPAPVDAAAQGLSASIEHLVAVVPDDVTALKVSTGAAADQTFDAQDNVAVGTTRGAPARGWLVNERGGSVAVPLR